MTRTRSGLEAMILPSKWRTNGYFALTARLTPTLDTSLVAGPCPGLIGRATDVTG
jgi:hypothetical protein